jgi:hypothetical protein
MPGRLPPAVDALRKNRHQGAAAWSRLLTRPIRLRDGTVLFTLKDAAERILETPASPSTRVAAKRIIDAALRGGDMASTLAAVRLALLKDAPPEPAVPVAKTDRASKAGRSPGEGAWRDDADLLSPGTKTPA